MNNNKSDWSIEVVLASSSLETAKFKPQVNLCLHDLQLKLDPTVFGELRYQVAEALKIAQQCEESQVLKDRQKSTKA